MSIENLRARLFKAPTVESNVTNGNMQNGTAKRYDWPGDPMPQPLMEQGDKNWSSKAKKAALIAGIGAGAALLAKNVYTNEETGDFSAKKLLKASAKTGAIGFSEGIAGVAGITAYLHRELTHRSVELAPWLQKAIEFEQRSLGVGEPYTWAAVHRIHHSMTDTTLFPHYKIYHAVKAAEERGIKVPEDKTFQHLDRDVDSFDLKTVMKFGESADKLVRERMGNLYRAPEFADEAEIQQVLNPTEPQYFYLEMVKKRSRSEYFPDDIARILLTDPHSPPLVKRENGVQGVAMTNVSLYQNTADMFRFFPEFKPEDLQIPEDFDPEYQAQAKKRTQQAVAAGFAMQVGAMYLMNRDYSMKGLGKAILEGSAANGARAATEIFGGNVTNSAGHMGDPVQTELAKAFLNREYRIKLKSNGTYETNTIGKGVVGRLASWATLDEVGGQDVHHRKPWKIAYTEAEGRQAIIEAPWGSLLHYLAYNEKVDFINPGKGFMDANGDQVPNEARPDVVHPAVKEIQEARSRQYLRDHPNGEVMDVIKPQSGGISRLGRLIFSRDQKK